MIYRAEVYALIILAAFAFLIAALLGGPYTVVHPVPTVTVTATVTAPPASAFLHPVPARHGDAHSCPLVARSHPRSARWRSARRFRDMPFQDFATVPPRRRRG